MGSFFVEYAPTIVILLYFFIQYKIFVMPEQLEKKHREITTEMSSKYVSYNAFDAFKQDNSKHLSDIKDTLKDIQNFLMEQGK